MRRTSEMKIGKFDHVPLSRSLTYVWMICEFSTVKLKKKKKKQKICFILCRHSVKIWCVFHTEIFLGLSFTFHLHLSLLFRRFFGPDTFVAIYFHFIKMKRSDVGCVPILCGALKLATPYCHFSSISIVVGLFSLHFETRDTNDIIVNKSNFWLTFMQICCVECTLLFRIWIYINWIWPMKVHIWHQLYTHSKINIGKKATYLKIIMRNKRQKTIKKGDDNHKKSERRQQQKQWGKRRTKRIEFAKCHWDKQTLL